MQEYRNSNIQFTVHTYLRKLRTGMRIDDPGSKTLSVTSKIGSLFGISIDDAITISILLGKEYTQTDRLFATVCKQIVR